MTHLFDMLVVICGDRKGHRCPLTCRDSQRKEGLQWGLMLLLEHSEWYWHWSHWQFVKIYSNLLRDLVSACVCCCRWTPYVHLSESTIWTWLDLLLSRTPTSSSQLSWRILLVLSVSESGFEWSGANLKHKLSVTFAIDFSSCKDSPIKTRTSMIVGVIP